MMQCVDALCVLIDEKIRLLKKNKYLANADWIFIEKKIHIENPYNTNKVNDNNRYRNLMNDNIQSQHSHQSNQMELNQIKYDELLEETRIRVLNIQKV